MRACILSVWPGWCAKSCSATDGDVLANFTVSLWIKMGLCKDVHFTFPGPVPIDDLPSKVGDMSIVESAVTCGLVCVGLNAAVDHNLAPQVVGGFSRSVEVF